MENVGAGSGDPPPRGLRDPLGAPFGARRGRAGTAGPPPRGRGRRGRAGGGPAVSGEAADGGGRSRDAHGTGYRGLGGERSRAGGGLTGAWPGECLPGAGGLQRPPPGLPRPSPRGGTGFRPGAPVASAGVAAAGRLGSPNRSPGPGGSIRRRRLQAPRPERAQRPPRKGPGGARRPGQPPAGLWWAPLSARWPGMKVLPL